MSEPVSRLGTARVLVLLGSGLQLAFAGLACFLTLVFGPALPHRGSASGPIVLAVVVFVAIVLVDIVLAILFALRAATIRGIVAGGCGMLLAGTVLAVATLLLIVW